MVFCGVTIVWIFEDSNKGEMGSLLVVGEVFNWLGELIWVSMVILDVVGKDAPVVVVVVVVGNIVVVDDGIVKEELIGREVSWLSIYPLTEGETEGVKVDNK